MPKVHPLDPTQMSGQSDWFRTPRCPWWAPQIAKLPRIIIWHTWGLRIFQSRPPAGNFEIYKFIKNISGPFGDHLGPIWVPIWAYWPCLGSPAGVICQLSDHLCPPELTEESFAICLSHQGRQSQGLVELPTNARVGFRTFLGPPKNGPKMDKSKHEKMKKDVVVYMYNKLQMGWAKLCIICSPTHLLYIRQKNVTNHLKPF